MALKDKYLLVSLTINKVVEESFNKAFIEGRKDSLTSKGGKYTIFVVAAEE